MGFVFSPYTTVQGAAYTEEMIRGDPEDLSNVFQWDNVTLSLPGSNSYKSHNPSVYKAHFDRPSNSIRITNDFQIFVDDVRTIGTLYEEC